MQYDKVSLGDDQVSQPDALASTKGHEDTRNNAIGLLPSTSCLLPSLRAGSADLGNCRRSHSCAADGKHDQRAKQRDQAADAEKRAGA